MAAVTTENLAKAEKGLEQMAKFVAQQSALLYHLLSEADPILGGSQHSLEEIQAESINVLYGLLEVAIEYFHVVAVE